MKWCYIQSLQQKVGLHTTWLGLWAVPSAAAGGVSGLCVSALPTLLRILSSTGARDTMGITSHCNTLHHTALHYVILHIITSHCTSSRHTAPHHVTLHHIMLLHCTTLRHTAPHYVTQHHITSHCTTLRCYTAPHYILHCTSCLHHTEASSCLSLLTNIYSWLPQT